jgi:hypothetical protein
MRIFALHVAAFVAGVLICAVLNLRLRPATLWFPWVLMPWGIVIATHALALLLRKTRRRERIYIDPKACASIVHVFAYLAVVLLLFFVNLTVTPKVWWFYWVALGWGIGSALISGAPSASAEVGRRSTNRHGKLRPSLSANGRRGGRRRRLETSILRNKCVRRQGWIEQAGRLLGALAWSQ